MHSVLVGRGVRSFFSLSYSGYCDAPPEAPGPDPGPLVAVTGKHRADMPWLMPSKIDHYFIVLSLNFILSISFLAGRTPPVFRLSSFLYIPV